MAMPVLSLAEGDGETGPPASSIVLACSGFPAAWQITNRRENQSKGLNLNGHQGKLEEGNSPRPDQVSHAYAAATTCG